MPAGAVNPISSSGLRLAKLTAGDVRFRFNFRIEPVHCVQLTPVNGPRQLERQRPPPIGDIRGLVWEVAN